MSRPLLHGQAPGVLLPVHQVSGHLDQIGQHVVTLHDVHSNGQMRPQEHLVDFILRQRRRLVREAVDEFCAMVLVNGQMCLERDADILVIHPLAAMVSVIRSHAECVILLPPVGVWVHAAGVSPLYLLQEWEGQPCEVTPGYEPGLDGRWPEP